ncbi:MAG: cation-efflux pump [Betaproteobacteria bacterium HGW-Betaproteobacteria-13]|uniref:Cation-efflux pump n=2 Tax=Parazoarcus communis TaxID=41977 RepID=A0A2U8H8Z9_9RHOO|nr:cation-efflux pump [Parazoarcus communis]PKO56359.1 MAG: cation-efflux pump [Betaproteobacteria bacterium HGW-Betaproteobacteria-21]PKO80951.1 MAG: cation-efflux pump [Betaproteobacteria bacterium HGW-Betaproteobacteria-13]
MEARHYFWMSTAAAVVTIVLKTLAWWMTDSISLLSDAMESFVNLAGASFALWMITIAKCPPDDEHPLGHGKAEYFSAGFEGVLIFGAAGAIIWSAVGRLFAPVPLESIGIGLAFSVGSSLINLGVAVSLGRAAVRLRSIALEGSSRHLMTDVWTSAGVVVGLILAGFTGWLWLDAVVAILVGLHILTEGWGLIRSSAHGLMDAALPEESIAAIETTLRGFSERGIAYADLRTRRAGAESFVYVDVLVPPDWSIVRTHDALDEIESAIRKALPGARVFTHPEPLPDAV